MKTRNIAIAGFLAFQIAMPISYYLSDDPTDERFAWRMFSVTRMTKCTTTAKATTDGHTRDLNLREHLHVGWISNVERNRIRVVDAYGHRICDDGADQFELTNTCVSPAGNPENYRYTMFCETRKLEVER